MHDAAPAFVFWADEEPTTPRTRTRDSLVQAHSDDGLWHRLTPDHTETACGRQWHPGRDAARREQLAGNMCPDCFTAHERARGADNDRKAKGY